jgi:hypothetical protein
MATKKIIFFTAGIEPTGPEATAIAKLQARTTPDYSLVIRNRLQSGVGESVEACDFVAGTVPASGDYDEIDVIDEDAMPPQNLLATEAIVQHNVDIVVPVTGVYATKIKATVVAGVITGFVLS